MLGILSLALPLLLLSPWLLPYLVRSLGAATGWYIQQRAHSRRQTLLQDSETEEREQEQGKPKRDSSSSEDGEWEKIGGQAVGIGPNGDGAHRGWKGIVGFFHPFCNAGGGGERVLWAAIRATQLRWPEAVCVVYTGDHDVNKDQIIKRVQDRFNITLHPPNLHFLYLSTRHWVLPQTWPHFTLLGQSLGSIVLALDAFTLLVPDIFVDTMGFAFTLWLCKFLFPSVPTGAYVHYPTISTDMLQSLDSKDEHGLNAGAGKGVKGNAKRVYWRFFAWLYARVGASIDVVMTNSTWTQAHIKTLWGPGRAHKPQLSDQPGDIVVVFPPVAVEELTEEIEVSKESEAQRLPNLLYIAQFRPEKNHTLVVQAFAKTLFSRKWEDSKRPKLVLVGSVRDDDDAKRVYKLRLLAHELQIKNDVEFVCDASWPQVLDHLRKSSVGVNSMWNEHFGIGVVEYQAAGLISVVNNSGGPKEDIVVDYQGEGPTGFHASNVEEYATGFTRALDLGPAETVAMRLRARKSAERFTEAAFAKLWVEYMGYLVTLQRDRK
ncbi:putative peroxisomal-coenzyme A synthetase [Venturia inaequalis]|nr:putative peroxisomal-coenzyme A synthetase [Venturia inaequalis]